MYKTAQLLFGQTEPSSVIRIEDGACIPFDPANTDYAAYLKFLEEGNEPLPPDEGEA
jgi:hypothetical protein